MRGTRIKGRVQQEPCWDSAHSPAAPPGFRPLSLLQGPGLSPAVTSSWSSAPLSLPSLSLLARPGDQTVFLLLVAVFLLLQMTPVENTFPKTTDKTSR